MPEYRFILEPYSSSKSRYTCPSCGRRKTFTRYVDLTTNEYISPEVGKCNRLQKCNYHYPPKRYFEDKRIIGHPGKTMAQPIRPVTTKAPEAKDRISFIEKKIFLRSQDKKRKNNLLSFLEELQKPLVIDRVKRTYALAASLQWKGACIFWQIDEKNRVRTGKVMLYNRETGRKTKVNWVHAMLRKKNFHLKQCLFGLHLLHRYPEKPIGLVESEKTAVIASMAFPKYLWMATGGLLNLKPTMLVPLAHRKVVLFPDAGCYQIWKEKIKDLPRNIEFHISERVEREASPAEKEDGWDLADYILRIWEQRKNQNPAKL